jgi:phosphatidyl-myo-inositol dimannoside synthase
MTMAYLPDPAVTLSPTPPPAGQRYAFVFLEIFSCEGGIQSYVKDLLMAYGQQSTVAAADVFLLRDAPADLPSEGYDFLTCHGFADRWPMVGRLRLLLAVALYLGRQRPDRVICGHILLLPWVAFLCRRWRVPYTVITYGKEVWFPLEPGVQRALQGADQIWAISRYSRDRACAANQLNPDRVQMMPCVVDGEVFSPGPADPNLVATYGLAGCQVLMTVARLWAGDIYKGVDVTIRALPRIVEAFPTVKYLVIGRGDDQPRLAALATTLGVGDRVVFAGFVPTAELVAHYRLADAYVMPSQEGFGIVYLEALACGLPVLSGDQDGSADPLQDGRLGWRVPHRDPEAVATACIAMLQGQDRRCQSAWLRAETLAQFSAPRLAEHLALALQTNRTRTR